MKKLKLDPEELAVEAFEASEEAAVPGSVAAHEALTSYGPWLCLYACGFTDYPCDPSALWLC